MLRIRAGAVHPVTAPPITDGAVLVGRDGKIAAVGPHPEVPAPAGTRQVEFPTAVLVPGLVNTHTHLELTHLAGKNPEREFARWIRTIRTLKDATTAEEFAHSAEQGVRDSWAAGVTCVADTGSTGAPLEALVRLGARGIYYQEVFAPDPRDSGASLIELQGAVARLGPLATGQARLGVSPHAPYTVSEPLYRAVAEFARRAGLRLAVHLAEALRARGIAIAAHGLSPVQYLGRLGLFASGTCLCIHCVQVDAADIATLARAGAGIAHCPRSNRAHGHGTAPLAAFRAAGLAVGLGTDSIVSTGDANLWAEASAAGLAGEEALRLVTLGGAEALGLEREIGSLDRGKDADLAVFPATALTGTPPPAALLTVVAGRVVRGYIPAQ